MIKRLYYHIQGQIFVKGLLRFILFKATDGKHHLHYGGICCYSCRAFFRRAHQSTKSPSFKCRKKRSGSNSSGSLYQHENINCVIDGSARRQCQLCRYKRCLEIGINFYEIWLSNRIIFLTNFSDERIAIFFNLSRYGSPMGSNTRPEKG